VAWGSECPVITMPMHGQALPVRTPEGAAAALHPMSIVAINPANATFGLAFIAAHYPALGRSSPAPALETFPDAGVGRWAIPPSTQVSTDTYSS